MRCNIVVYLSFAIKRTDSSSTINGPPSPAGEGTSSAISPLSRPCHSERSPDEIPRGNPRAFGLAPKVRQAQDDTYRCPSGRSRTAKQHRAKRRWNLGRIFSYTSRSCHGENFKNARFREKKRENESLCAVLPPRATKGARGEVGAAKIAFDKVPKKCYNITVHKRNSCKTREP